MLHPIEKFLSLLNRKNTRACAPKHHNCRLECLEDRALLSVSPSTAFSLHSNEGAAQVIYLDFDGHITTDTDWNSQYSISRIETPAYSIDSDSAFSEEELDNIYEIWAYASEYFAPFDVDVTTDLSSFHGNNGIRVAIGGRASDWFSPANDATGVAFVESFTNSADVPAFIFSKNCYSTYSVGVTIAHEVGHSLGLNHDGQDLGTNHIEYYEGENGWSPIMGSGNGPVQQWSKGEYYGATNTQDDLLVITTQNGFGYRADDYGNTTSTASTLTVNSYNEFHTEGIIERNTDSDYFKIVLGKESDLYVKMSPSSYNNSLDTQLKLYNSSGNRIASSAPTTSLSSEILVRDLAAGTYYIQAANDGCGSFYSSYGSLGSYVLTGTVGSSAKTTVTTKADVVNANDGVLSLREAIANAQIGDRIVFSKDVFKAGDVIQLASELTISTGIIIDASDLYDETTKTPGITIKAANGHRHFTISGGTASEPVTLQGLALVDGFSDEYGGSILLSGSIHLKQCRFENNQAGSDGGVIYSEAYSTQVYAEDSQFIGNQANYGGIIELDYKMGTINFISCTATGNKAFYGGAFYAGWSCAVINVLNSVLAGNEGGAIATYGTCNIQSSTIAGNTGGAALDLSNSLNTQTIENSIITGNYSGLNPSDASIEGGMDINYSLIGNAQGLTLGIGCIAGTKNEVADPGFVSFTPNTGTWSKDDWEAWDLSLDPNTSVAINAGSNAKAISAFNGKLSEETDVTGINSRLTGADIDLGAYEQPNLAESFSGLTLSTNSPNQSETIQAIPNPPYAQVTYQWYRSSRKNGGFTLIENEVFSSFTPDASCLNQYLKCVASDSNGKTISCVTDNVVRVSEKTSLVGQTGIFVTSTLDVNDQYDGVITLREAIAYAAELEIDTIKFAASLANKTITLNQGELVIDRPIAIDGSDLGVIVTTTSGRLFNVSGGTDSNPVTLIGLNLTGGNTTGSGGAFLVEGTLELHSCNVYDNYADGDGGVFYSDVPSTHIYVFDSTLTGNEANYGGVCCLDQRTSELSITSSLVAGNQAISGGGVFFACYSCAVTTLLNSVVIGNIADYDGVGYSFGQILVYNSTIAGNTSTYYTGGIHFGGGRDTHEIKNSIIALNTVKSTENDLDPEGMVTVSYSLIGNGAVSNLAQGSGNYIGSASSLKDPGFVSLNALTPGTWTKDAWKNWDYAIKPTSIAVNAGSNSLAYSTFGVTSDVELAAEKDITGKSRLINGVIDMGAYEYGGEPLLVPTDLLVTSKTNNSVSLRWDSVPNASGYLLQYSTNSDFSGASISNVTSNTGTISGLTQNTKYYFRVKAVASGSFTDSNFSSMQSAKTDLTVLSTPTLDVCTEKNQTDEWSVLNMKVWTSAPTTQTLTVSYDSTLYQLDAKESLAGVVVSVGNQQTVNGNTTVTITINCANTGIGSNTLAATLAFTPILAIQAGDSVESGISVDNSPFNTTVTSMIYDLDDSGDVEIRDLVAFARVFGKNSTDSEQARLADFDGNGTVTINDLVLFARNFGKKSPRKQGAAACVAASQAALKLEEMPAAAPANVNDVAMAAYFDEMDD